ncbi:hypothetical protein AUEXF2481DRAFT_466826 [Aureobasidium subglaciale EXF-2481]|uniref:Uncharacterized protein n=1 Tax=Aureobasidium subglaciale (strain EXF-2481) TaxID=1043005 RepID=A0A074YX95_AURSE|nr:uncharacterized protein AUEXF2481DRAFT_466826 [Aureobasidium subglaciale EXF-2481]KAI5202943.1 hypothetical protein E4T38_05325 [Aureobasidium subglaciale]KAI5221825.1 hypothetical protein E4T40_05258 [Aureobasidium subglaciale]KAI5225762.1 hypothetical protein E4T41_05077 [Aureobasidium subglaciale]KAI5261547.1 hypothetical protein E4T46_04970 [Aureobasidium subglaciale]KEQ91476.1 hypothetical protein AUEXF2481DRAFT_466826 [Aureobasidium subglaciale EXF-2481]
MVGLWKPAAPAPGEQVKFCSLPSNRWWTNPIAFDAPNVECSNQKHNTHVASHVKHPCHARMVEECRTCSTEVVKQPVRFTERVITVCIDKFILRTQLVLLLSSEYFRFVLFSAKRLLHSAPVRIVPGHVEVGNFLQGRSAVSKRSRVALSQQGCRCGHSTKKRLAVATKPASSHIVPDPITSAGQNHLQDTITDRCTWRAR